MLLQKIKYQISNIPLNFAHVSIFYFFICKNSAKIVSLLKAIVWELCYIFFSSVCSFRKIKRYYKSNCKFYRLCIRNPASGLLQISCKLEKMRMTSHFADLTSSSNFYDVVLFLLISYWSKFYVNIITGSGVKTILFWPWIWKSEIPLSEFCPISEDWDELGIPNLARMFLMKCYWILAKCQGCRFYRFWVITGKPTGRVKLFVFRDWKTLSSRGSLILRIL